MRVLLLVSDSRPAGKSGGRAHFSPGFVDVDEDLAREWIEASLALNVVDGAVHAPPGATLCTEHAAGGVSCSLLAGHKGGRHYDFSGRGEKGDAVGAGWWNHDEAIGAVVTLSPAALARPCPTTLCVVGKLGHAGECSATPLAAPAPSPDVDDKPRRKGKA